MALPRKVLKIITQMWHGKWIYWTITATTLLYNSAIFYCAMTTLHTACPIFNTDANVCNSWLPLTNELTSGSIHQGANTDYHSAEKQSQQMASSRQMSRHQAATRVKRSDAQTQTSGALRAHRRGRSKSYKTTEKKKGKRLVKMKY